MVLAAGAALYFRPLPAIEPATSLSAPVTPAPSQLAWPAYGQAALGAKGFGLLATSGAQSAAPMASLAKVITALVVLRQKPLAVGEPGPTLTLSANDIDYFNHYYSLGGSVVKVAVGEQISQYQMLQGLLIPSGNNLADSLAVWAFGSLEAYLTAANQYVKALGLGQTYVADASGFSPSTASSAADMVKLGLTALDNPVIAGIAAQPEANLPVAGTVHSVNALLNHNGIIGIKTGNTDQAGGCYLFAAERLIDQKTVTVVGAIMGAADLGGALRDSLSLLEFSQANFVNQKIIRANQPVAIYKTPWGTQVPVVAQRDLSILVWKGQSVSQMASLQPLKTPSSKGSIVGTLNILVNSSTENTPAVLGEDAPKPPWTWRLLH